jgi:hypothetical protein
MVKLLLPALLALALGLLPSVVIRYVIARSPFEKKRALRMAAAIAVTLTCLLFAFGTQWGTAWPPGVLYGVVSYFILRKGHKAAGD